MKDLFKGCWTIPNLLSVIRILLIPVFAYLFFNDMKIEAVAVLAFSALTDTFDGQIARKFKNCDMLSRNRFCLLDGKIRQKSPDHLFDLNFV